MLYTVPALASQEAPPSRSGSVLNILLLGCIAYFLVRSFRRRSGDDEKTRPGNWSSRKPDEGDEADKGGRLVKPMDRHEAARQAWGALSSETNASVAEQHKVVQADGFDEVEFLEGAKLFFSRFQQALDSRELQDLKNFMSEDVYSDAVAEAQRNPMQAGTEVLSLNARLMEMKTEGGRTCTTVFYDAQLRKGAAGEQPALVRSVWEFSRDDLVENALWILEKINKVDQ